MLLGGFGFWSDRPSPHRLVDGVDVTLAKGCLPRGPRNSWGTVHPRTSACEGVCRAGGGEGRSAKSRGGREMRRAEARAGTEESQDQENGGGGRGCCYSTTLSH